MNEENSAQRPAQAGPEAPQPQPQPTPGSRAKGTKKGAGKKLLIVLIWLVVIALAVFATLFISAKVGQFNSIGDLITYIRDQVGF